MKLKTVLVSDYMSRKIRYSKESIKIRLTKVLINTLGFVQNLKLNPYALDRFTPSRARCAENCGSALIHR